MIITQTTSVDANTEVIPKHIDTNKRVERFRMVYDGKQYVESGGTAGLSAH